VRNKPRNLTPEELALVPRHIEKWKAIALSTERIDRQAVLELLHFFYNQWDIRPDVRFFDSPYALLKAISTELPREWDCYGEISFILSDEFDPLFSDQLDLISPLSEFLNSLWRPVLDVMFKLPDIPREIASGYCHDQVPQVDLVYVCEFDFYSTVLGYSLSDTEQLARQMSQRLLSSCGWMFPLYEAVDEKGEEIEESEPGQDYCWICDRPTKILVDSESLLHAEGEPAIEFADGFAVWAHHGTLIYPPLAQSLS
jgi:hypothetical protein